MLMINYKTSNCFSAVTHGITPVEYIIDIDISFAEFSLQEAIKSYLAISFPLLVSASTANISRINVTTGG